MRRIRKQSVVSAIINISRSNVRVGQETSYNLPKIVDSSCTGGGAAGKVEYSVIARVVDERLVPNGANDLSLTVYIPRGGFSTRRDWQWSENT
jgi:hypothetical protein